MAYTAYGYGDSQTWGGAVPYWEQPDRYNHWCEHCGEGMDDYDGEFGEWCSFRCWYLDGNIGSMKRELLTALQNGKAENWLNTNAENFSPSTYDRWERAINRINEKAAVSAVTLKAA